MASCTLDASVKIYSCRVDSIHSEAYKVLGGIGGGPEMTPDDEENNGGEDQKNGEGAGSDTEEGGKTKTKRRVSGIFGSFWSLSRNLVDQTHFCSAPLSIRWKQTRQH